MDPSLLLAVRDELAAREPIFHRPEHGVTRADFERITEPDFWEIGASGARYSRAFVLDELDRRRAAPRAEHWETSEFGPAFPERRGIIEALDQPPACSLSIR